MSPPSFKLTASQMDALKEAGSIGAGHTATGLSKMLGQRVSIRVPKAQMVPVEQVPGELGGAETLVAAVYVRVTGGVLGSMLLVFPLREALRLADLMMGKPPGATKLLDPLAESALSELGNISVGGYLTAMSELVQMRFVHSVPNLATDMLQAVLDGVLIELARKAEAAVVIETEFELASETARGHLLFIPDPEGLKALLAALGVR